MTEVAARLTEARDGRTPPPSHVRPPRTAPAALLALQASAGNQALIAVMGTHRVAVVQRRRVPDAAHADPLLAPGARDRDAHRRGMDVVTTRALSALTPPKRAAVRAAAVGLAGGTRAWAGLSAAGRTRLVAQALRMRYPTLVLGDPALIDSGPRPGTGDATNIAALAAAAAAAMGVLVAGARDADLAAVFGPSQVATVKLRYLAAVNRMTLLRTTNRIVTDRSGYNAEVGLGGLTNPDLISLSPETIDHPADKESVVTLIHEAMHAGVPSIDDDHGYVGSPSFTSVTEADKLDNAAHYEIPVRRMWGLSNAYSGVVFVPAGTSVVHGGRAHTAPPLTPLEQAARRASETARGAWAMGLNMHTFWVQVNLHRADWTGLSLPRTIPGASAPTFADCMPYWSNVEGLTVHQRPQITLHGPGLDTAPVTQVDVALSEGLLRLLGDAMDVASAQLDSPAHARAFLAARTTPAERSAARDVRQQTSLMLRALRRSVGRMTGDEARDVRVMRRMAAATDFSDIFVTRSRMGFR